MFSQTFAFSVAAVVAVPHVVLLHAHHNHQPPHSKVLTALNGGNDIPADGAIFPTAMYYAFVQVGSPPRDFAVGLDSGSGDLFVEGAGCAGCTLGGPNAQYDPRSSSTSTPKGSFHHSYKTCNMQNPSATCTLSGNMYYDQVSLGGFGPVQVKVGAIQSQTENFDTKKVVGGLMGLGGFDGEDVLATLANAGKCDRIWGLCMHEGRISNGTMTVGGVDEQLADGPINYVPNTGFIYDTVDVSSMSVGGKMIAVNDGAILDSGTNILLLSPKVFSLMQSGMCSDSSLAHCSDLWGTKCFPLSESQVDHYPTLQLQLNGVTLEMTSREYLFQNSPVATSSGQYCLGIRNGGNTGFIIGASTMRNYYVVIDRKNSRVGWGKVNKKTCGATGSPTPVPTPPTPTPPSPTPSPTPSGSSHYGQPPCKNDEVEVQLGSGSVCAAHCASASDCPSDLPAGTKAAPQCQLLDNSRCGLKCGRDAGCPDGAMCFKKSLSLTGNCVYSTSAILV